MTGVLTYFLFQELDKMTDWQERYHALDVQGKFFTTNMANMDFVEKKLEAEAMEAMEEGDDDGPGGPSGGGGGAGAEGAGGPTGSNLNNNVSKDDSIFGENTRPLNIDENV